MALNLDFPGTSHVGALMRGHDWSTSVLGEPRAWPLSLRTTVRLMLNSKFPMFVAWGSELGFLYNDAYAEILGSKHPRALGGRFQEVWHEIWWDISPIIDAALQGQSSYFEDLPLVVERGGPPEQAWFTFSYAPLHDDEGIVSGMFCSVVETTKIVRDRKLRQFQLDLADELHLLTNPHEIVATAVRLLATHLTVSRSWYAEIDDGAGTFYTRSGWFESDLPALPPAGKIDDFSPHLLTTLRTGKEFVCNDVATDPRTLEFAERFLALGIGSILIVPVVKQARLVFNINVTKRHAYCWTLEDVRAAKDVVDRTWVTLENAATQQRLKLETDKSDYILNHMAEAFLLVAEDGRITKVNAEAVRMLGQHAPEVLEGGYLALWAGDIGHQIAMACKTVSQTGVSATLELNEQQEGKGDTWLEMRISHLKEEGLAIFIRDVSAQKCSALALQRSEEHLSTLFEQTAAGIAERDLEGRLIRVNERLCELLGRPREEVLGINIHDLTHPDDRARSIAAFQRLIAEGQPFSIEKRYLKPDGTPVWVSTTVSPIRRSATKETASVLAVIVDITERKRAEEALTEQSRILEQLNQSGQTLSATLDLNTLLQAVTDSGRALTGAEFAAFFYNGKDDSGDAYLLYVLSGAPKEAFERLGHPRATAIFNPTFIGAPAIRSDDITKDPRYGTMAPHHGMPKGHLPVKSYLAAPVVSRSGEVIGGLFFGHSHVAVFTERSERLIIGLAAQAALAIDNARLYEQAQRAMAERETLLISERAARAEAEQLIRFKDEFLAMLAHELRNPLAPVSAAAEVLRMAGNDSNRVRQVSEIISRQIGHFTRLIDDLMDVSRVQRGLIQLRTEALDLKTIIGAAIEQVRPMIEARKHTLTTRINADYAIVKGDRMRLVQVLANLLTNAAKYSPANSEIALKIEADAEYARIAVVDNGNGIEASLLPYVFDLFTQGTRGLDRSQGGLGIGLALVKAIVMLHGGEVHAVSEGPGKGSTFTVTIPLMHDENISLSEDEHDLTAAHGLSILVVDDNADAANAIAILLKAVGHQVTVSTNAQDALDEAAIGAFDAFIFDVGLPDMSGYELAKTLQRRPGYERATYIALTGYGQAHDRQLSRNAGFTHHFVKPVNNQLLLRALTEIKVGINKA